MIKILHIVQTLGSGGGPRALIATAENSAQSGNFQHRVVSLKPVDPSETGVKLSNAAGIPVIVAENKSILFQEIENADIVHVSWWNTPEIYEFFRSELPPMRLVIWFHVGGQSPPQIITKNLVDFADYAMACSPFTYEHPVFQDMSPEDRVGKTGMVYGATDFTRLEGIQAKPHDHFNVGYLGTFSLIKMHRNFVSMSAAIEIPDVKFIVCGHCVDDVFKEEAKLSGRLERFDFREHVEDIKSIHEILDVFGFPLCEDTYAAAELTLQEAMYAGIPPVVFPHGGIKNLVINDFTGIVVKSELEYTQAVEHLYYHPEERLRLGNNCKAYAHQVFGAQNAAKKLNPIYERLMKTPKKQRLWGYDPAVSLLDQPLTLKDLTGDPSAENITGAESFIEALGNAKEAEYFKISMNSTVIEELLEADKNIAKCPRVMFCSDTGGILQYEGYYPEDPYLRLWAGLVWENQGKLENSFSDFASAINAGFNHWRVHWYSALVAEKAGKIQHTKKALQAVVQEAPEFTEAIIMLEQFNDIDDLIENESYAVNCPSCNETVYVGGQGQWGCPICRNEFVC